MLRALMLAFLFPNLLYAQAQLNFKHLTGNDGLSQNSINTILQDKDGLIWIGTQDGLNCYDGYTIKVYRNNPNDSLSLSDNFIVSSVEDLNGNLWFGTRHGLNFYNRKTRMFTRFFLRKEDEKLFHRSFNSLALDEQGNLIIQALTSNVLLFISKESIQIMNTQYHMPSIKPYEDIPALNLLMSNLGQIWIHTKGELKPLNLNGKNSSESIFIEGENKVKGVLENKERIWFGTDKDLYVYSKNTYETKKIRSEISVRSLAFDPKENLWVATASGLLILSKSSDYNSCQQIQHIDQNPKSISSDATSIVIQERSGVMLVGCIATGLNIYDPNQSVFKSLSAHPFEKFPLSDNVVWSIHEDVKKNIWIGTSNGLNKLELKNPKLGLTSTDYSEKNISSIKKYLTKSLDAKNPDSLVDLLNTYFISSIESSEDGTLWLGTKQGLLQFKDGKIINSLVSIEKDSSSLSFNRITFIKKDSKKRLCISTINGLNVYDSEQNKFRRFDKNAIDSLGLSSTYIMSTYEDKSGTLWICSSLGISKWNESRNTFTHYSHTNSNSKSLSYNLVTACFEDSKNRFWISTLGGGICLMDRKKETFETFGEKEGLANSVVYGILEDKKGNLWLGTNGGISKFNTEERYFSNYTEVDGILNNEFCQNAFIETSAGEMLWGSPSGLLAFDPLKVPDNSKVSKLILRNLFINYKPAAPERYVEQSKLYLSYQEKAVGFEFLSPDFTSTSSIEYEYMLEGFDETWIKTGPGSRMASYTNLPFGDYTLLVRNRKNNPRWNEAGLKIKVEVLPPFWLTWWFVLFEVLLGTLLLIGIVRYFSQRKLLAQIREGELQKKIHLERERISRDLHDNVGAQLSYIISSLDFISLDEKQGKVEEKKEALNELQIQARAAMQELRETIWAINKESIPLQEMKEKMNSFLVKISGSGKLFKHEVTVIAPENILLKPAQVLNTYRIFQEAVSNSLKHSSAKNIRISLKHSDNKIKIKIEDDGIGFDQRESSKGHYGLDNMKIRAEELGGSLTINSTKNEGTSLLVEIPCD